MRQWTEQSLKWYLEAGRRSDYPRVILDKLSALLRTSDILLDIGSGPGLFGLALHNQVKAVYNIDAQPLALACLERQMQTRKISNMHLVAGDWPQVDFQLPVDVILVAFSSGRVMGDANSIRQMLSLSPRLIVHIAPAGGGKRFFRPDSVVQEDLPSPHLDTFAILEQLGLNYTCQILNLDFGQPVASLEEAAEFLSAQLRISAPSARKHAEKIAHETEYGWYLPNPRKTALIIIKICSD